MHGTKIDYVQVQDLSLGRMDMQLTDDNRQARAFEQWITFYGLTSRLDLIFFRSFFFSSPNFDFDF